MFKIEQVIFEKVPVGDNQCRFDSLALEEAMQSLIKRRLQNKDCAMSAVPITSHHVCPTFVLAKSALDAGALPTVFRSYAGEDVGPSKCAIWQAARATSAAPSFFKEMYIDNPPPGISYIDGGLGYNNPSEIALREAAGLWPATNHFCLVSIGTGRSRAINFVNKSSNIETQHSRFQQLRSFLPDLDKLVPGWKTARNFPQGVMTLMNMASALSSLIMNSEGVHQRLLAASEAEANPITYFRFNVERDVGDIGFEDWKRAEAIASHTAAYLLQHETKSKMIICVKHLINPPKFQCKQV